MCIRDSRRLRARGQVRGEQGIEDYQQALELVTGRPYTQLRDGGGIWLADDRDDEHLTVAIVDVAHLTVTMALQRGDTESARSAAEEAVVAAPDEQMPRLDLAAVARAEGDRAESSRVVADTILRQRDAEGPIDPDARSSDLIESHGWAPRGPR